MAIHKIVIDLDDVLAKCTEAAMQHMGLSGWSLSDYPIQERKIELAYKIITGVEYEPAVFWEHFKREFWANIPPTEWCYELIDLCQDYVPRDNIAILTSPTKCGDCLAGKLDWISKYMPDWMQRQYLMSPRKSFCSSPDIALIDDCDYNLAQFRAKNGNYGGGYGVAMPIAWNTARTHIGNEMEYIKTQLDAFALI